MNEVKCLCGHSNPHGTVLCESCGRPIQEKENGSKLLDMKYDGSARRSQTYKRTPVDKIWNFFSSVKVGIWIIVLILIASAIGTILPQVMYIPPNVTPKDFYREEYGVIGQLYYQLGFHELFSSWWYIVLIGALAASLVIASLDRFVPLYRALKKQGVTRHESFMRRQRLFSETPSVTDADAQLKMVKEKLERKRYHVREENGSLLAEKTVFQDGDPMSTTSV